jgi:hypothetical protein
MSGNPRMIPRAVEPTCSWSRSEVRETPSRAMDKVKDQAEARRTGLRVAGTSADRQGPDPGSAGKGGGDGGISH